jgi:DNA-binding transcriptional LysR family regulator
VDPHLLRTFVTVAEAGSFSAAAQQLGYTQSAVSQQIAALESDLGTTLLHRRPVAPTDAGARLLEHAGPILLRLGAARADVARLSGQPAATVVLGATPMSGVDRAAAVLASVQRAMPRVRCTLLVAGRDAVAAGVATGTLDVGLVDGITAPSDPLPLPDAGQLTTSVLAESAAVAAFPVGHPLAGLGSVRLADLADATWIDAPDVATPLPQLRALAHSGGFRDGFAYRGTDAGGLLALIAAGAGLALLPGPLTRPGIVGVPVAQPRLVHRAELVHGSLTPPARALAEAFRN